MTPSGQTICLCMIVKNEAKVIQRCLDSVIPVIDAWCIVDTGSTDGTQHVIRQHMAHLPGNLTEEIWTDFATNRTSALSRARQFGGYSLIIDADDFLEIDPGFVMPELTTDSVQIDIINGGTRYQRPQIVRASTPWVWRGMLHEFLTAPGVETTIDYLPGIAIRCGNDGARRHDPSTYSKDALALEAELLTETDPWLRGRYQFYLAQSWKDAGEKERAIEAYLKRAELGFWEQEVYISYLTAGRLMEDVGRPFEEIVTTLLAATRAVPDRCEATQAIARVFRNVGQNRMGMTVAERGLTVPEPTSNVLFHEPWVYEYGLLDEYAINAYWCGAYRQSLQANLKILERETLAPGYRTRIVANAAFSAAKLGDITDPALFLAAHTDLPQMHEHPIDDPPLILMAILAKQKEGALPLYLECIDALDYPKHRISLYIRTNNNTDRTRDILVDWIARTAHRYHFVHFDDTDVDASISTMNPHEWNPARYRVLNKIRDGSLAMTKQVGARFYFTADSDNFIHPSTLRDLVALNLPIAAPFLRLTDPAALYSNFHAAVDETGYFKDDPLYHIIINQTAKGIIEVPVVHCTYLVREDAIPNLHYQDGTEDRMDYVIFSESARAAKIPQFLDNRHVYGYITFGPDDPNHHRPGDIEKARELLGMKK